MTFAEMFVLAVSTVLVAAGMLAMCLGLAAGILAAGPVWTFGLMGGGVAAMGLGLWMGMGD